MFEIILFLFIGVALGVLMGLIPGIHPNLIVLFVPLFMVLSLDPLLLLVLIVAMAVTNSIVDFIPSILFGAPDAGNELSILPGHKMLMHGYGYQAIKLTVVGGIGAVIFCVLIMPFLVLTVPPVFTMLGNYVFVLLIGIVFIMVLTEKGKKKITAGFCFLMAGFIGLFAGKLPIDNNLMLFPIFSGLFGLSLLFLQVRNRVKVPSQHTKEEFVSRRVINRGVISGSLGGVATGLLPGVGSSEIASLASVDKNDKSFLVTIGALTTANILISLLAMLLIGKTRSGTAVAIDQLMSIGSSEFLFIIFVSLVACGLAALLTLYLAKVLLRMVRRFDYTLISCVMIVFIVGLILYFTSYWGLLLAITCCALGIFTNLAKIKRGNLMGVLILPTILFYVSSL